MSCMSDPSPHPSLMGHMLDSWGRHETEREPAFRDGAFWISLNTLRNALAHHSAAGSDTADAQTLLKALDENL
jgi:hypothetical protein